jgi:hypothetical protein
MAERYRLTGYLATATSVAWTSGQTLDSALDNEWTDLSDAIDNSTNKYPFVDIEIVLASAAFTGTDSAIEVYLVPSVDGTNYGDWTGNVTTDEQENNGYFVGSKLTSGATAAQRLTLRDIPLPNGLYKYGLRNRGNVTLGSSGNTVKWRPHSGESTTV